MSYYGIHGAELDYMICASCGDEAFAWMTEYFACPMCGSSEYVPPDYEEEADKDDSANIINGDTPMSGPERIDKKRKRTASDEGKMHQ